MTPVVAHMDRRAGPIWFGFHALLAAEANRRVGIERDGLVGRKRAAETCGIIRRVSQQSPENVHLASPHRFLPSLARPILAGNSLTI